MKTNSKKQSQTNQADVSALRSSPVHNLIPVSPTATPIEVAAIEKDPTNPGSVTKSLRNERRAGSIRDSYDILAKIVYPIIVCQKPNDSAHYIQIDGYGRLTEAMARGQQKIEAIVYPPLTLEQRICLRQTLNAAQEPFDAVSIISDLQQLAKERSLDLMNPDQIRTLVRDMPERVRKYEKDLIMLARLHPRAVESMGESYRQDGETIGLDKFRGIARVLRTMETRHPKTVEQLGGPRELSLKLSKMYIDKKFSEGTRSQEAIRQVAQILSTATPDGPEVADYFNHERPFSELVSKPVDLKSPSRSGKSPIVDACRALTDLLMDVDSDSLASAELRALERTGSVLNKVLTGRAA